MQIMIDARPEPLGIDKSRAAILVIDMQNDFGSKGRMFGRAGMAPKTSLGSDAFCPGM